MDASEILACNTAVARAVLDAASGMDAVEWRLAQAATSDLPVAAITEQLRCAKRLARKLPSWAKAGCLVTQRALEQASSEVAATAMAAHLAPCGQVLDGTAGLGVDAWALAGAGGQVTACEADAGLAALTVSNLARLGSAVAVAQGDGAAALAGGDWDLVWFDPDRRPGGKRVLAVGDCLPDVCALLPELRAASQRSAIKLAPALAIDDLLASFPDACELVQVGAEGECKAWVVVSDHTHVATKPPRIAALLAEQRRVVYADAAPPAAPASVAEAWAVIPEACIRHAGVGPVAAALAGCQPWLVANSWWTSATQPVGAYGQTLAVLASGRWQLGEVRKQLRRLGLERVNVSSADPRLDAQRIQRELKLPQGGDVRLLLQPDANGRRHWLLGQTVSSNAGVGDHVLPA